VMFDPVTKKRQAPAALSRNQHVPQDLRSELENEYWSRPVGQSRVLMEGSRRPAECSIGCCRAFPTASGTGLASASRNPIRCRPVRCPALVAMDAWVTFNTEPPPSRMPKRADARRAAAAVAWVSHDSGVKQRPRPQRRSVRSVRVR
jgi:hypothetical protein